MMMMMSLGLFKIDDLPPELVFEILCRLPLRSAFQCKCVSKGWSKLISDPSFMVRFLCLQGDKKTPITSRMIFQSHYYRSCRYYSPLNYLRCRCGVSFLPSIGTLEDRHEKCRVLATYNDLILCYWPDEEDEHNKFDWTIWNPYTMQRVTLPRLRRPRNNIHRPYDNYVFREGIICEPYYNYQEENGATSSNSKIVLNVDYKCRVVRIRRLIDNSLNMNIYFSEAGEWREFNVSCPQIARVYLSTSIHAGVVYHGKLYWLVNGHIVELDALALDSNTSSDDVVVKYCRFIEIEFDKQFGCRLMGLGVCRGRMRAMSFDSHSGHIHTWELRSGDDDLGKWCFVHRVSLLIIDDVDLSYLDHVLLSLDSSDEDTIYVLPKTTRALCRCNVLTGAFDDVHPGRQYTGIGAHIHPFTLPWWPTPVPRVKSAQSISPAFSFGH